MNSALMRWSLLSALILTLELSGCALGERAAPGSSSARTGEGSAMEPGSITVTRSSLKQAQAALAQGRAEEALRIYQAILEGTKPEDPRRAEAHYWMGILRMSPDPALRDVEKARASLGSVAGDDAGRGRQYEAGILLALADAIEADRAAVAEAEAARNEASDAAETCRGEKDELNGQIETSLEEVEALKAEVTARRAEADGLREELRRKDEALRKVKEVLVGWKPSR